MAQVSARPWAGDSLGLRVYCTRFNRWVHPSREQVCGEYQGPLEGTSCLDCDHCREKWGVDDE